MKKIIEVKTEAESHLVSEAIRTLIPVFQIFCFHGDLGAGKTTYIKQIVKDLGVTEGTSSPSFAIVNEYAALGGKPIYHFDLYRLRKPEELLDIGWEDYLNSNAPIFIEWPEMAEAYIPDDAIHIFITDNLPSRTILITDKHE
jgi:tRNA threonylcarbamoyladenosine biosynthesis protein TsaE